MRTRPHPTFERILEVPLCLLVLIFLSPLCLVIAMLVASDGGPVVFRHERIGRDGVTFKCLKFRSMVVDSEARLNAHLAADPQARAEWRKDHKLRDDPRITRIGKFLRKSSLDELPQLFNVLRGEMSLVGPRPIVRAEVTKYGRNFRHYASIRPGITGLWQVSGRNNVDYRRRVAMDVLYAQRKTPWLYVWILMATIPAVLMRHGAH